jgi:Raf kinase inhibitor-like YbhB/YbcL family protein
MKNLLLGLFGLLISASAFAAMTLESADLKENAIMKDEFVFNSFGCSGKNNSPELTWKNAPKDTKSFAVTMYDPDAPTGSGWWHWTLVNIPSTVTHLARGISEKAKNLPAGSVEGRTDFGKPGYGGPCPPPGHGDHHYHFTVYALKVPKLELNAEASGAMVGYYLNQNALEHSSLIIKYGRK